MVVGVLFLLLLSWLGASRNFIELTRLREHVTVIKVTSDDGNSLCYHSSMIIHHSQRKL
jgi:hypothetical protein